MKRKNGVGYDNYYPKTNKENILDLETQSFHIGETNGLSTGRFHHSVGGGTLESANATENGAIKITLPVSWSSSMMNFWVDIYEYESEGVSKTASIHLGGYNYITTTQWIKAFANTFGGNANSDHTIRFGHDGSNCAIWIGETGDSWQYPVIKIRDFHHGYNDNDNEYTQFQEGWSVGFVGTIDTVNITLSNNLPLADTTQVYSFLGSSFDPNIDTYEPTRTWVTHVTNADLGTRPIDYMTIAHFSSLANKEFQIGTSYGVDNEGFWIRRNSDNAGSENGIGWQNWRRLWTEGNFDPSSKMDSATSEITSTGLQDLVVSGCYTIGTGCTDIPAAASLGGQLLVIKGEGTTLVQMYTDFDANSRCWMRTADSVTGPSTGNWWSWREIYHDGRLSVTDGQFSEKNFTSALNTKLGGISDNANNYTHPANHSPSIITQDASNRFHTDAQASSWDAKLDDSPADSQEYVRKDNTWVVASGGGGGVTGTGTGEIYVCTQAEYDALPAGKLTDNKIYFIKP